MKPYRQGRRSAPARPTRRRLLHGSAWAGMAGGLAGATGLLTGCEVLGPQAASTDTPAPEPDPDLPEVRSATETTQDLLELYAATAERHAALREKLTAYTARHRRHLTALMDGSVGPRPTPEDRKSTSTAPAGASPSTPARSKVRVPASAADAVHRLIERETKAAAARRHALRAVRGPELARLLASIGACEAVHAIALRDVAGGLDG